MIVSHIILKNWRNFKFLDVDLQEQVFIVGPNACGKSNFLDVFRFVRDLAKAGGGLQKAVEDRGGLAKIRCLSARSNPKVEISLSLSTKANQAPDWQYEIGLTQETRGYRRPILAYERVWKNGAIILERPNSEDKNDELRLTQTYLEQVNSNSQFREIVDAFDSILYLHLVPQLVRYPESLGVRNLPEDPYGSNLLERITKTTEKTRRKRLSQINQALKLAVPQLKDLVDVKDEMGVPHLEAVYEHWQPNAGKQREDQFSDGTLRLISLFWSLLEGDSVLLLEEPELSLNAGIIRQLPRLIYQIQRLRKRQVIISTHSYDLLADESIGGEQVLLMLPSLEGTTVKLASQDQEIRKLLESGLSVGDVVLPKTVPAQIEQLTAFLTYFMTKIFVNLAVEDDLSEAVLKKVIATVSSHLEVNSCLKKQGAGYIKSKINQFNQSARGTPFIVLTDLDQAPCPSALISSWLKQPQDPNLLFRVAVCQT